ncbi:MAG TPA: SEC-C metal-binding domain-containing protein [Nakamurella sp.]|nr:SEC-C metal-binding domain-containing protein [Nakamurella sp.]
MGVRDVARLDRELDAVLGARPRDPAACADVLGRAAFACRTDPAAAEQWVEAELLDELADCYEALGRVDEAITVMRRALQVGWAGVPDGRCRIAELLMRDGRVQQATDIWEQVRADTPDDVWLYNNAGVEYAEIDDHETALTWLTRGLRLAMATGDPEGLVEQLADLREESLSELGRREDQLQRDAEEFLDNPPPPPGRRHRAVGTAPAAPRSATAPTAWPPGALALPATATAPIAQDPARRPTQVPVAFAWFPATDYPQALRRWPQLTQQGPAKGAADHAAYNLALQRTLTQYADSGSSRLHVAAVRVEPFLAWCQQAQRDPATPDARSGYAAELLRRADPAVVAWPPGRNQRCWCGSGRKYKQCCGSAAR